MKRDSNVWWWVIGGAVLTAVTSRMDLLDHLLPAAHTDKVHALIELVSLIVGIVAGKMAASPLAISDEGRERYLNGSSPDSVDPRKLSVALVVIALGASVACASLTPAPAGAPTSAQVVRSELIKAVDWASTLVEVARTAQQVEIDAYRNGRLSNAQHRAVQTGFDRFFTGAIEALKTAQDLNQPETTRWTAAKAVAALGGQLLTQIEPHLPPEVRAYLDSFKALLQLLGHGERAAGEEQTRG